MKTKIITAIYSNLNGSEFGGRPSRGGHYRYSLLSLLKITDANFICYTSNDEYDSLVEFFYVENNISKNQLDIEIFDLEKNEFSKLIKKYKDYESTKKSDRCIEIQYMKFIWFLMEDMTYDYYYWFDAGLSHCGIIPNKYLAKTGVHNSQYYESSLFNNIFLKNLINKSDGKFLIVSKENSRNYWSGMVNEVHFNNYNSSRHIIGGFFGGKKEFWPKIIMLFTKYVYQVTEYDNRLYHEENIMTLMYNNHPELFKTLDFDIWWHEDERIAGFDIIEHTKINKSFYKIIEELNNI